VPFFLAASDSPANARLAMTNMAVSTLIHAPFPEILCNIYAAGTRFALRRRLV
jgi:hypothetical protein